MQNNGIQTQPRPHCPACQSEGSLLYADLTDRLFNVQGAWNMKKCRNAACGTLWLDPAPTEESLPGLYKDYYTHANSPISRNLYRIALTHIRAAYLQKYYGYATSSPAWMNALLARMAFLHPVWKDALDAGVFYLPAQRGGRLLDVGCGSGAALQFMAAKGWDVTGVDFDEGAANNARRKGLTVQCGTLAAQNFAADSFDAVVMSHVIEHVPAPIELLGECRRILKKGGILTVLTPNADSRLHQRYGRNWLAVDAPRHLQVFTAKSLANIAGSAGYSAVETFTSMHGFVSHDFGSAELAAGKKHVMGRRGTLPCYISTNMKGLLEGWRHILRPNHGTEAVLVCHK